MDKGVLGRTNIAFPSTWLSLVAAGREVADPQALANAARAAKTVIDISSSPALWGGMMRGSDDTLMVVAKTGIAKAMDEQHAHDLLQAHLIEVLSALGRESIDFYFLDIDEHLSESQINGALIALEEAREEHHIRFTGIAASDVLAATSPLHFHDAFEALLIDSGANAAPLRLMSKDRRMAIITRGRATKTTPGEAALVQVQTPREIKELMSEPVVSA